MKYCQNRLARHFDKGQPVYFAGAKDGFSLREGSIDDGSRYIQLDSSGLLYDEDHGLACDLNTVAGLNEEQIGKRLARLQKTVDFIDNSIKLDKSFLAIFVKEVDGLAPELMIFERGYTSSSYRSPNAPELSYVTAS